MTDQESEATARAPLDLETAELISSVLTRLARPLPAGAVKPTPEQLISSGLLDVRLAGDHVVCHYDPATADPQDWDRALTAQLGDARAALVRYQPAGTSPADLVALLERVLRRDWHPRAASSGLAAGIDWEREVIDVTLGVEAMDDVAATLVALTGDCAVVRTGARPSRTTGAVPAVHAQPGAPDRRGDLPPTP